MHCPLSLIWCALTSCLMHALMFGACSMRCVRCIFFVQSDSHILRTALHTLVCTTHDSTKSKHLCQRPHTTTPASIIVCTRIDKDLDHLLECVLLSLLCAFVPLCFMCRCSRRMRLVGPLEEAKIRTRTSAPAPLQLILLQGQNRHVCHHQPIRKNKLHQVVLHSQHCTSSTGCLPPCTYTT